jgi:uncharacterized phage-associated protein
LTNLKINKLLYYAQGHYLARTGKPLFDAQIEAWGLGPVIPEVYHEYKSRCKDVIINAKQYKSSLTDEEFNVLLDVAAEYGKYTAAYLVNKTHAPGTPWAKTPGGSIISIADIETYFKNAPRLMTLEDRYSPDSVPSVLSPEFDCEEDENWASEYISR